MKEMKSSSNSWLTTNLTLHKLRQFLAFSSAGKRHMAKEDEDCVDCLICLICLTLGNLLWNRCNSLPFRTSKSTFLGILSLIVFSFLFVLMRRRKGFVNFPWLSLWLFCFQSLKGILVFEISGKRERQNLCNCDLIPNFGNILIICLKLHVTLPFRIKPSNLHLKLKLCLVFPNDKCKRKRKQYYERSSTLWPLKNQTWSRIVRSRLTFRKLFENSIWTFR